MNWKLRFKNPTTAVSLIVCIIGFIYQILAILGITPNLMENDLYTGISAIALFILGTGIVTDPTTKGILDSLTALGYDKPKDGKEDKEKMMLMPGDIIIDGIEETASQKPIADLDEEEK